MGEERICHVTYSENNIPHVALGRETLIRCKDCKYARREGVLVLVCRRLCPATGGVVVPELGYCHEGTER